MNVKPWESRIHWYGIIRKTDERARLPRGGFGAIVPLEAILNRLQAQEVTIGIDHAKGPSRTVVVEARRTEDGRLEFVLPQKPSPPPSPTSIPPGASSPRTSD